MKEQQLLVEALENEFYLCSDSQKTYSSSVRFYNAMSKLKDKKLIRCEYIDKRKKKYVLTDFGLALASVILEDNTKVKAFKVITFI